MSKIERLTPEQEAQLAVYRQKWTDIGLSTQPADRQEAEDAINESYRLAGLQPPKKIVWCGSPLSQGLTRAVILNTKRASVRASVRDSVGDSVWASVGDSVRASVRASVWDSVGDSVGASVGDSVRASVGDSVYGQHDAHWLGFYEYFRDICGLATETDKLAGLIRLAKSAGWVIPHKNICWVSERHNILERDDRGRLHNLTGPAVAYPDGWSIYAVHGVRVPEYVIMSPETITVENIDSEQNAEVRRVMVDRYGADRYLVDSNAVEVHQDDWGILYRKDIPDDEPLMMVKVVNSTPEPDGSFKDYFLRVPPTVNTALEAVAWTFDKSPEEYRQLVSQT
jgi:hypothetical protein